MPARPELLPGEEVLVDIRPHWTFLSGPLLAAILAVGIGVSLDVTIPHTSVTLHWFEGVLVALPCLWLAARVARWRRCWIMLTSDRLVDHWGAAARSQIDFPLDSIERVTVVQTPLRRLLGTGAIDVSVWDQGVVHRVEDARKPAVIVRVIDRRLGPPPVEGPPGDWR